MTTKRILICINSDGLASSAAQEAFDLALASATFEQDISILCEGSAAGLLLNLEEHDAKSLGRKDLQKALKAFPIYGINKLYVTKSAMLRYGLKTELITLTVKQATLPCTILSPDDMAPLYANHDIVLRF